jgi:arylsulfatase A-like enzyme
MAARTRSTILILSAWSLLITTLARLRIHHDAPLPSTWPLAWLMAGMVQDLAVLAILAAGALVLSRFRRFAGVARVTFGTLVVLVSLAEVIGSEAIVFYGHVIRPEDLRGNVPIAVVVQSLSGVAAALLVVAVISFASALMTLRQVDGERLRWLTTPRCLVAFVMTVGIAVGLTHLVPRVGLARNPIVSLFAIEREAMQSPNESYAVSQPAADISTIHGFAPRSFTRNYADPNYPLAYIRGTDVDLASLASGVKPNIIFFLMESVRAEEVGCYGADPPGITPNIDALARDGIRIDPAYSAGTYTASAELAIWYGLTPIPREVLITSRPDVSIVGFPQILRAYGWKTFLWIHGGDSNFYRRDSFYIPRGVQVVDGRSFSSSDPKTNWGYSDRALARNAITILNRAREPFVTMMLTVTNHHPFQLPADADPPIPLPPNPVADRSSRTADMLQTVHYTDEALGDFIRAARKRPWFAHSIIVVMGDHGVTFPPYERPIATRETLLLLLHRIPLVIYSPMLTHALVLRGPGSQIDLLPTLLHLAGITTACGLGVDLLEPDAVSTRVLPMWSPHGRVLTLTTPTRMYHASYRSNGPLDEQTPVETLFDPVGDPEGLHDLSAREPRTLARFRRLATVYTTVYPWLVVSGKSGIPPLWLHAAPSSTPHKVARSPARIGSVTQ